MQQSVGALTSEYQAEPPPVTALLIKYQHGGVRRDVRNGNTMLCILHDTLVFMYMLNDVSVHSIVEGRLATLTYNWPSWAVRT